MLTLPYDVVIFLRYFKVVRGVDLPSIRVPSVRGLEVGKAPVSPQIGVSEGVYQLMSSSIRIRGQELFVPY